MFLSSPLSYISSEEMYIPQDTCFAKDLDKMFHSVAASKSLGLPNPKVKVNGIEFKLEKLKILTLCPNYMLIH